MARSKNYQLENYQLYSNPTFDSIKITANLLYPLTPFWRRISCILFFFVLLFIKYIPQLFNRHFLQFLQKNNSKINSSSATHPLKRIDTPQIQTEPFPLFEIKYIYIYTYTSISLLAHLTVFIRERRPGARHHLRGTDIPTYRGRRQTTCPPPLEESTTALFEKERFTGIPLPFSFLPSFTHQMVLRWTIDWWPIARCPRNPVLPPETVQVCRHARSPLSLFFRLRARRRRRALFDVS